MPPKLSNIRGPLVILTASALLAGCGDAAPAGDAADPLVAGRPEQVTYAPNLNVNLANMETTPSGLHYEDLAVGEGEMAVPVNLVSVHYTGWLPNGQQFDSSRTGAGTPFQFNLGTGEVIPGWDEGVAGMRVGGRRRLVIPPELAYGERGAGGVIPPNSTLVFEVELLGVN
jgi:FKBP-type peptidyl-prolyl cis-trans isomerase FkpA